MKLLLVSEADLGQPAGNTIKVSALASELAHNGIDITLMVPSYSSVDPVVSLPPNLKLHLVHAKGSVGTLIGMLNRYRALIKGAKSTLRIEHNTILEIENMIIGGYFALAGFSGFVLNADGLSFAAALHSRLPWFVPLKLYSRYLKWLEGLAARRASKVIAISEPLKDYLITNFKIAETKIEVVHNGYFESKARSLEGLEETVGVVSFVGLLARWARVDKVIRAADALKDEAVTFYIVGDGLCRGELEDMTKRLGLSNVIFTGYVPVDEAYRLIAASEVMLSPMADSLSKAVSCPISQIECMALGKAMVIDGVGEIATLLKNNNAALVCNPGDENEFIESIHRLIHDKKLRENISSNAKRLSQDFGWEKQGRRLAQILRELAG